MRLAIHLARRCLLGHSPIPCLSQKFLLRLRVFANAFNRGQLHAGRGLFLYRSLVHPYL